ncbi:EamA family transporter [Amycolatopsis jiangsuensis]|uniref:Drug/metabolite transporter (DMT)-like permease n=1 Tax=Amycolatopsis jiangsuensis TaxID=1181879 RepID=A0A840ILC9_9PSEU|nr:EamA family transporter [Amycolatopsis jiangsuensis]MBB4682753.1 drug/metabolite transporter (DMT)-like permease [Amycolatopsis jiangsuensis]
MTTELPVTAAPGEDHRGRGILLVLLAAVFFSTSGSLGKPAMVAGMTPEQVAAIRIGGAGLLLAAGTAILAPRSLRVRRGEWPMLLAYGLLGVAGTQLMYFIATDRIPVGIAILLEFMSPVLIALWVRVVRRTRLPGALWGGIALAMAGLALVAQVWQGAVLDALGLLAGLGAAVCSAGYFLIGERAVARRDPLGLVTWGMVIGAVIVGALAPPWTVHWSLAARSVPFGPWTPPVWLLLAALVLAPTVISYLLGISALRHLPASVASVLGLVEPVATAAFAWALLGESLAWPQAFGALLLLAGAYVVQRKSAGIT